MQYEKDKLEQHVHRDELIYKENLNLFGNSQGESYQGEQKKAQKQIRKFYLPILKKQRACCVWE